MWAGGGRGRRRHKLHGPAPHAGDMGWRGRALCGLVVGGDAGDTSYTGLHRTQVMWAGGGRALCGLAVGGDAGDTSYTGLHRTQV